MARRTCCRSLKKKEAPNETALKVRGQGDEGCTAPSAIAGVAMATDQNYPLQPTSRVAGTDFAKLRRGLSLSELYPHVSLFPPKGLTAAAGHCFDDEKALLLSRFVKLDLHRATFISRSLSLCPRSAKFTHDRRTANPDFAFERINLKASSGWAGARLGYFILLRYETSCCGRTF